MGHLSGFMAVIVDFFCFIKIPQDLCIRSPVLGLGQRVLQLAMIVGIGFFVAFQEMWSENSTPVPYAVSMWPEVKSTASSQDANVRHCTDPKSYRYVYRGGSEGDQVYEPQSCFALPGYDGFMKEGSDVLILTHIIDNEQFWSSSKAGQCGDASEAACKSFGGQYSNVTGTDNCFCSRRNEFFTHNPEEVYLHFLHGYSARRPDGKMDHFRASDPNMITLFTKPDGSPCQVNGRTKVEPSELTAAGITGSMKEWLACAGVTLDYGKKELGDDAVAALRMMGAQLKFELFYTNIDWDYRPITVCRVTPYVHATWTSTYDYKFTYGGQPIGEDWSSRNRLGYGVLVSTEVVGNIKYFSIPAIINGIITVIIMLQIPHLLTCFIVEYCMGNTSRIYLHAKRTNFNLKDQLRVAIGRSLLPIVAFRCMVGGNFRARGEHLPVLKKDDLEEHFQDIFAAELSSGKLEDVHIGRMVSLLCQKDERHKSSTKLGEEEEETETFGFQELQSCVLANDTLSRETLVRMIHKRQNRNLLERFLNDSTEFASKEDDKAWSEKSAHVRDLCGDQTVGEDGEVGTRTRISTRGSTRGGNKARHSRGTSLRQSHATEEGGAEDEEDQEVDKSLDDRVKAVEAAAQQALKGLELALARARTAEEKAAFAEMLTAQHTNTLQDLQQTGPNADVYKRLAAAEEVSQQAREEAQAAVFGVEAMRGSVEELQRLETSMKADIAMGQQQEEMVTEVDDAEQEEEGPQAKAKPEAKPKPKAKPLSRP